MINPQQALARFGYGPLPTGSPGVVSDPRAFLLDELTAPLTTQPGPDLLSSAAALEALKAPRSGPQGPKAKPAPPGLGSKVRDGKFEPAKFDAPSGISAEGASVQNVVDGSFENGVLTSFARGRGLGDCGIRQQFVWDGARLRLSRQSEMGECRGNPDYITTWRADVVRK